MKTYRVFTTRHYIAVEFFDIEAENEKKAKRLAQQAARKLYPDAREHAVDNHWYSDESTEIPALGYSSAPFEPKLVFENKNGKAYQEKR